MAVSNESRRVALLGAALLAAGCGSSDGRKQQKPQDGGAEAAAPMPDAAIADASVPPAPEAGPTEAAPTDPDTSVAPDTSVPEETGAPTPDATVSDAALDADALGDASSNRLCPIGQYFEFDTFDSCQACAPDSGGSTLEIECRNLTQVNSVDYDPETRTITLDLGYQFNEVLSGQYAVRYRYATAGGDQDEFFDGDVVAVGDGSIEIELPALPAGTPRKIEIQRLDLLNACGVSRDTNEDIFGWSGSRSGNSCGATGEVCALDLVASDDGGTWTATCVGSSPPS
jgi:hypothetical protein